jgi:hypothetical protein
LTALPYVIASSLQLDTESYAAGCYLFPVALPADELVERHRIVAIPASAFGSEWNGSILTSLSAHFADGSLASAA